MLSSSEWSSGCESGWTLYLDQSVSSPSPSSCYRDNNTNGFSNRRRRRRSKDSWTEEDLSMLSDASSGPRNISYEDLPVKKKIDMISGLKKERKREKKLRDYEEQRTNSVLDDTASSSPLFSFPHKSVGGNKIEQTFQENTLDYSQGFSATPYQDKAGFQEQYGYLHMETRF